MMGIIMLPLTIIKVAVKGVAWAVKKAMGIHNKNKSGENEEQKPLMQNAGPAGGGSEHSADNEKEQGQGQGQGQQQDPSLAEKLLNALLKLFGIDREKKKREEQEMQERRASSRQSQGFQSNRSQSQNPGQSLSQNLGQDLNRGGQQNVQIVSISQSSPTHSENVVHTPPKYTQGTTQNAAPEAPPPYVKDIKDDERARKGSEQQQQDEQSNSLAEGSQSNSQSLGRRNSTGSTSTFNAQQRARLQNGDCEVKGVFRDKATGDFYAHLSQTASGGMEAMVKIPANKVAEYKACKQEGASVKRENRALTPQNEAFQARSPSHQRSKSQSEGGGLKRSNSI
ncbi:MAG: hypothetical protein V4568_18310 [Pseudomonadota bacterium]